MDSRIVVRKLNSSECSTKLLICLTATTLLAKDSNIHWKPLNFFLLDFLYERRQLFSLNSSDENKAIDSTQATELRLQQPAMQSTYQ